MIEIMTNFNKINGIIYEIRVESQKTYDLQKNRRVTRNFPEKQSELHFDPRKYKKWYIDSQILIKLKYPTILNSQKKDRKLLPLLIELKLKNFYSLVYKSF